MLGKVDIFQAEPGLELLTQRSQNEAYCCQRPDDTYLLFLPDVGNVYLKPSHPNKAYTVIGLDILANTCALKLALGKSADQLLQLISPRESGY